VTIEHDSDNIQSVGTSAPKACNGSDCVDYRRRDAPLSSEFLIRRADCAVAKRIEVRAKTRKDLERLLETVAVIPPHAASGRAIPLSSLVDRQPMSREERMRQGPHGTCSD
jgi:hypothetical protein